MTSNCPIETDVCIVGGGPAGSTIAHQLALLGHQTCLVEKTAFPRSHIGESLPPSILRVFDLLGVRAQIEAAGFFRPQQSLIRWSSDEATWKTQAGEVGFQVDRGRFDQLLLKVAQAAGVQVLQPACAGRPHLRGKHQWIIPIRFQDQQTIINARFLVDASGKHSSLSRKKQRPSISTLALYGYWRETPYQGCESRVEAGMDEWFWGASLPDSTFNATIFLDAKRYASSKIGNCEQLYRALLAKTNLLKGCLDGYLVAPVRICDASCYLAEDPIRRDWIKVGEAAFSLDPLSSQGVQMAVMSAFQGSVAVHTILTDSDNTNAAITFYRNKLQETVERAQMTAAQFYATQNIYPGTSFWEARAQQRPASAQTEWECNTTLFEIHSPVRLSTAAKLLLTPVIQGNSIRVVEALHHPGLDSPVAYLGNLAIAPFLTNLVAGQTVAELMQQWSRQQELSTCWQMFQWLWVRHIFVRCST
jgi:flavin-dependent dehydrogenase